jgi:pyruvate dehydrogenase (quinone)
VVAIVGQQARAALGGDYQQEVDLLSLFKDVAHEYIHAHGDGAGADAPPGGGKSGGAR